jgi:hypothetical protein
VLGIKITSEHPGDMIKHLEQDFVQVREVESYFKKALKQLYTDRRATPPSINVVLFLAGDEAFPQNEEDTLKRYVSSFKGSYRVIRGLNQIKSAQTAAEATNK